MVVLLVVLVVVVVVVVVVLVVAGKNSDCSGRCWGIGVGSSFAHDSTVNVEL